MAFELHPESLSQEVYEKMAISMRDKLEFKNFDTMIKTTPYVLRRIQNFSTEEREKIGKSMKALREYLGLTQSIYVAGGLINDQAHCSGLEAGTYRIESEKMFKLPHILAEGYKQKTGRRLPPEARVSTLDDLIEKGLRFDGLDKNLLRAGVWGLMREQKIKQVELAERTGLSFPTVSHFLNNKGRGANASLENIHKMGKASNCPDIFTLEQVGLTVLAHATSKDKKGRPAPRLQSGGHHTASLGTPILRNWISRLTEELVSRDEKTPQR